MFLCLNCLSKAKIVGSDYCLVCDRPSKGGITHKSCFKKDFGTPQRLITVFQYRDVVREVIRRAKYGRKEFIALRSLGIYGLNLLSGALNEHLKDFYEVYRNS